MVCLLIFVHAEEDKCKACSGSKVVRDRKILEVSCGGVCMCVGVCRSACSSQVPVLFFFPPMCRFT